MDVCVLLYGDHPELAERCLNSIARSDGWYHISRIRLGLNQISLLTREVVDAFCRRNWPVPILTYQEVNGANVWKYPLMRRMLHDPEWPISDRVMWFDDDSFIVHQAQAWWSAVDKVSAATDMAGWVHHISMRGRQLDGIRMQPWFDPKVPAKRMMTFVTGGWWVAKRKIFHNWDWPTPVLKHNGGDSMLGELCRHQRYQLTDYHDGVAINADAQGKGNGAARRGANTSWPWQHFVPEMTDDVLHQLFKLKREVFLPAPPRLLKLP